MQTNSYIHNIKPIKVDVIRISQNIDSSNAIPMEKSKIIRNYVYLTEKRVLK